QITAVKAATHKNLARTGNHGQRLNIGIIETAGGALLHRKDDDLASRQDLWPTVAALARLEFRERERLAARGGNTPQVIVHLTDHDLAVVSPALSAWAREIIEI